MTRWRGGYLVFLLALALPLLWPIRDITSFFVSFDPDTLHRVAYLAGNTARLALGTLLLAVPLGTLLALALERTDLPGRRLLGLLLLLPLFLPLPLVASGWQTVLGAGGWFPLFPATEWMPWSQGIGSAIWLHSLAGLPWVVLLVGLGLRAVEPELEEDASTIRSPLWVLFHVTLPRARVSIVAAALWLTVQVTGEITITDLMQVRTFAEEVYTQFVGPDPTGFGGDPLPRALAVSLLGIVPIVGAVVVLARHADRLVPPGNVSYRPTVLVELGWGRIPCLTIVLFLVVGLLAIPTGGLLWRAGHLGAPAAWSLSGFLGQVRATATNDAFLLLRSVGVALLSGMLAAGLALVGAWLARESRPMRTLMLVIFAVAWATPGPVLGLSLASLISALLDLAPSGLSGPLARLLWHGPSSLPLVIVGVFRFLPFAAALVWPAVRRLPVELLESARLDGAGPFRELTEIVAPLCAGACVRACLAVGVLSLGELSAGKLVSTPGAESFAEVVWTQMHYGITADLAARCLLLLAVVLLGALAIGSLRWFPSRVGTACGSAPPASP